MDIEAHTVTGKAGDYARGVWLLPSPTAIPHRLCVFLDAELYMDWLFAPAIMGGLMASGQVAPMTTMFVSHLDAEARHYDYPCNARYSEFIAHDVVGWARERIPNLIESGHIVCGVSLSGLASAFLVASHPGVFSSALCQSPSFWWNDEAFSKSVDGKTTGGAYWISVGDGETASGVTHSPTGLRQNVSQLDSCANAANALRAAGNRVRYSVFQGGHEAEPWRAELPAALTWTIDAKP